MISAWEQCSTLLPFTSTISSPTSSSARSAGEPAITHVHGQSRAACRARSVTNSPLLVTAKTVCKQSRSWPSDKSTPFTRSSKFSRNTPVIYGSLINYVWQVYVVPELYKPTQAKSGIGLVNYVPDLITESDLHSHKSLIFSRSAGATASSSSSALSPGTMN